MQPCVGQQQTRFAAYPAAMQTPLVPVPPLGLVLLQLAVTAQPVSAALAMDAADEHMPADAAAGPDSPGAFTEHTSTASTTSSGHAAQSAAAGPYCGDATWRCCST